MFWIVFFLIVLHGAGCLWLELLNYLRLEKNRGRVPEVFDGLVDAAAAGRAEGYTRAHLIFGLVSFLVSKAAILIVLLCDGFAWISRFVEDAGWGPISTGLLFFALLGLAGKILSLPFEWYGTFRLEERFGFNRTTYPLWFADMAKGLAVTLVLGGALLAAVLLVLYETGAFWWLICWAVVFGFSLLVTILYPLVIAPLFNKFTPRKEKRLHEGVVALMEHAGIRARGVFVMDAGKRSRHSNAYFTGFGRAKRIVLFDTLVAGHTDEEILAVLAHEAGHWKLKHVLKGLLLGQTISLALFAATGWLVAWNPLYATFGFETATPYAGLLLASIVYGPVTFLIDPFSAWLSRRHEFEADAFAREAGLGRPLCEALLRLACDNLSNLNPHPVYVFFRYSHPPVARRVEALRG